MTLTALYNIAECDNIKVDAFALGLCESLSISDNGECFIAIDPFKIKSTADETVKLAHELGHCETGAFYNQYALIDDRAKQERRATKWAIKMLVPEGELKEACRYLTNRWELSLHFGVTEDFMQQAMDYYNNEKYF